MVRVTRTGRRFGAFALQADVDIAPLLQKRSQVDVDGGAESDDEQDNKQMRPSPSMKLSKRREEVSGFRRALAEFDRETGYVDPDGNETGLEGDDDIESEDEDDDFHSYLRNPFAYARPSDIALAPPPNPAPPATVPTPIPYPKIPGIPGNVLYPNTNAKERARANRAAGYKSEYALRLDTKKKDARRQERREEQGSEPVYPQCAHVLDFIPAHKRDEVKITPLKTINRKRVDEAESMQVDIDLGSQEFCAECVSSSGVKGLRRKGKRSLDYKGALEKRGFRSVTKEEYDGVHPVPVIDAHRRRFMTLAGRPVGATPEQWKEVHDGACAAVEETGEQCNFTEGDRKHRRGNFRTLAHGWTFGGGKLKAGPSINTVWNHKRLTSFVGNDSIKKICGFQSNVFHMFAPVIWQYYFLTMTALVLSNYGVSFTFAHSVFAALTINFGPVTACFKHVDDGNLSWGWCAITALGNFDPDYGGHLVIWELKLIIPFPPGSTILLPSALLNHSNIPIRKGEVRYSLTQYSASGLFRWVENNHKSDKVFEETHSPAEIREWKKERAERWKRGLEMFTVEPE